MTVNYTTNLALGQPVTGTESGTWGDDVNNSVTSYLDIAIAGGLSVTVTVADVTLTLTQGTSSATNIGSTTAQYAILNVSGAMTAARNLILPSSSRQYVINNNTTGGFALTVKGSATSGVTMVNGEKAHVFWNGTDYAKLSNTPGGAGTFSSITNTGLTSGRVVYSTTGGLETDSAGLTFDGTNFATTGTATAAKLIPTGSSATGNGLYLPAANSVGISTNGTNAVYIDSSGNVAIGSTATSGVKLFASANNGWAGTFYANSGGASTTGLNNYGITFGGNYSGGSAEVNIIYGSAGAGLDFSSYNGTTVTQRMRIDSSGNVNIGSTANYGGLLSVNRAQTTSIADLLTLRDSSAGVTFDLQTYGDPTYGTANRFNYDGAYLAFRRSGTEAMRIDSSGNVGIGGVPSNRLQVANGSASQIRVSEQTLTYYFDFGRDNTDGLFSINGNQGLGYKWKNNGTEAMRIDSSGNVGIGTTSPGAKLDVTNNQAALSYLIDTNNTTNGGSSIWRMITRNIANTGTTSVEFYKPTGSGFSLLNNDTNASNFTAFNVGASERMRITSGGSLLVGTTTPTTAPAVGCQLLNGGLGQIAIGHDTSAVSGNYYASFAYNSGVIGTITQSGTTAVLYNTTSDQRLKENIQDADSTSSLIDSLQVRQFDWKSDNSHQRYGFIAQELVTVAPEAVHQPADPEEMMAVDYSKLVPMLVKEIQSLRKRLAALEST